MRKMMEDLEKQIMRGLEVWDVFFRNSLNFTRILWWWYRYLPCPSRSFNLDQLWGRTVHSDLYHSMSFSYMATHFLWSPGFACNKRTISHQKKTFCITCIYIYAHDQMPAMRLGQLSGINLCTNMGLEWSMAAGLPCQWPITGSLGHFPSLAPEAMTWIDGGTIIYWSLGYLKVLWRHHERTSILTMVIHGDIWWYYS